MDTINKQQAEQNVEDLYGDNAIKKMKELTDKASTCFFCTNIRSDKPFSTRPMSVQKLDEKGCFWFLSEVGSDKNIHLSNDSSVQLLFQGSDYSDFLNVYGSASITKDKKMIKELWQ